MGKWLRIVSIAAVLAVSTACSGSSDSPTGPTSGGTSPVRITVAPSPVTAERCNPGCNSESGGNSYAFAATMTINVADAAGAATNITSVTIKGTAGNTTYSSLVFSSSDITDHAGSAHINAHGSLSIPMRIVYNTPSGSANLSMDITIELDSHLTASSHVNVI